MQYTAEQCTAEERMAGQSKEEQWLLLRLQPLAFQSERYRVGSLTSAEQRKAKQSRAWQSNGTS